MIDKRQKDIDQKHKLQLNDVARNLRNLQFEKNQLYDRNENFKKKER